MIGMDLSPYMLAVAKHRDEGAEGGEEEGGCTAWARTPAASSPTRWPACRWRLSFTSARKRDARAHDRGGARVEAGGGRS